jgi:hypothetical protein
MIIVDIQLPIYVFTLVIMYFLAGVDKLLHFEKVVSGLHTRISLIPIFMCKLMIVCAIIIELLAPFTCVYASLQMNNSRAIKFGLWSTYALVLFTIMATLLYHFPPTTSAKYYPFVSNMATTGGLLMLSYVFKSKS